MACFGDLRHTDFASKANTCNQLSTTNNGAKTAQQGLLPLNRNEHPKRRLHPENERGRISKRRVKAIGNSAPMHFLRIGVKSSGNTRRSQRMSFGHEESAQSE